MSQVDLLFSLSLVRIDKIDFLFEHIFQHGKPFKTIEAEKKNISRFVLVYIRIKILVDLHGQFNRIVLEDKEKKKKKFVVSIVTNNILLTIETLFFLLIKSKFTEGKEQEVKEILLFNLIFFFSSIWPHQQRGKFFLLPFFQHFEWFSLSSTRSWQMKNVD